jgi:acyl-CoA reductase-like NAD-dependent aldehyde dehydrogenase
VAQLEKLEVRSPYDGSIVGEVPIAGEAELERALATARALFGDRARWLPATERRAVLRRAVELMTAGKQELAEQASREGGKPLVDSLVEAQRGIEGVGVAIEEIPCLTGREIAMGLNAASTGHAAFTFREPVGVVAAISAFNHPLNLIVHQVMPAVAVGCPVIVKPARATPLSCLAIADILKEAGLPDGWVTPLVCGPELSERLAADPRLAFLSFIGSAEVGWRLRSRLAPGVSCTLEHGGAAPVLIEPDADIADAVPRIAKGGFYHAGQVCVSVQRLFVHARVLDEVAGGLVDRARGLKVGDPLDPATDVGPLITRAEVRRVHEWVREAAALGGEVLCGGEPLGETCYAPTVILDPPDAAKVSRREVFGPVVAIYPYEDRSEAIRRANQLDYCFQAAVFTRDLDAALDCARQLEATAVMVNEHSAFRVDWMPFGGRRASGLGLGGIGTTMRDLTAEKLVVVRSAAL